MGDQVLYQFKFIIHVILPLIFSGFIYLLFREESLKLFRWIDLIGLDDFIDILRTNLSFLQDYIPDVIIYSVVDGLWTYSLISATFLIWSRKTCWMVITAIIALIWEFGQFLNIIPGMFCFYDLILILTGIFLPFLTIGEKRNEKFI